MVPFLAILLRFRSSSQGQVTSDLQVLLVLPRRLLVQRVPPGQYLPHLDLLVLQVPRVPLARFQDLQVPRVPPDPRVQHRQLLVPLALLVLPDRLVQHRQLLVPPGLYLPYPDLLVLQVQPVQPALPELQRLYRFTPVAPRIRSQLEPRLSQ